MAGTTPGGLPFPTGGDFVVNGDNAIEALARAIDPGWTALNLTADWIRVDATYRNPAYQYSGGILTINGTLLRRLSTSTIAPGTWYAAAILPAEIRPILNELGGVGTIGVAGQLGSAQWRLSTGGTLAFNPTTPSGTMATGGAQGNNLALPTMDIRIV
jgi:hypothetical protein